MALWRSATERRGSLVSPASTNTIPPWPSSWATCCTSSLAVNRQNRHRSLVLMARRRSDPGCRRRREAMRRTQGRRRAMNRFLIRAERTGATTSTKEQILGRPQREKRRGVAIVGSRLLPLRSTILGVTAGVRLVGLCNIAESNCAFHIFTCENRLVLPLHENLDILRGHSEQRGRREGTSRQLHGQRMRTIRMRGILIRARSVCQDEQPCTIVE